MVLTDVVMPKMTGPALFEHLTASRPGIKVLYMSGYSGDVIAYHGVLDQGVELVRKPFTVESLTRKVREVLDGP